MANVNSFKLNDEVINFNLVDQIEFNLNGDLMRFDLNAETEESGNFRLLEDGDFRLLEDGDFRLLE